MGTLGSLGSDLAFSVSFSIATELLDAAGEAHMSEDELIGVVLGLSIIFAAVPVSLRALHREVTRMRESGVATPKPSSSEPSKSGVLEFATLLVGMAQRIALSICVQLLSSNVRSRQPLRSVRVVSLLAVAIFFLFLENTSSVGATAR